MSFVHPHGLRGPIVSPDVLIGLGLAAISGAVMGFLVGLAAIVVL